MSEAALDAASAAARADGPPELTLEGLRATITLRRPAEHNRIDPEDIGVVMGHLDAVDRESGIAFLVLRGTGPKTFCSGYTIDAIRSQLDERFERMLDRIESMALPTVCALNGSVYGGGTDLAMCCDFRIGVHGSRMFMPAARFGLHYYPGGLRRFVSRLGPVATKKIFLTARTLEAEEMLRIGYLTDLVPRDGLDKAISEYEAAFAECEPGVVRSMKRHIDGLVAGTWQESHGRQAYEASLRSRELAERLARR
jgi:enoyl-CoA hydratase/carnithine racemase